MPEKPKVMPLSVARTRNEEERSARHAIVGINGGRHLPVGRLEDGGSNAEPPEDEELRFE